MQNIPMFNTELGVATLILKEIPYSQIAYIILRDTAEPEAFLQECVSFCRVVGAEKVYAAGHAFLENYPFHTAIWEMARSLENIPDTDACLLPVTQQTLERWREIYNDKMAHVHNAAYMSAADAKKMLVRGDGYFVHRDGKLLGIGMAAGEKVDAVVSVVPGAGQDVLLALSHALFGERITLQVASENTRAIKLYEKLDFIKISEVSRWYKIL